ncbi:hypothetical protein [Paenibacillus sp. Root52]|nr:hypothetical protein [Paenibacillus sp. Root52]
MTTWRTGEQFLTNNGSFGLEEVKRILDTSHADAPTIPELVRPAITVSAS